MTETRRPAPAPHSPYLRYSPLTPNPSHAPNSPSPRIGPEAGELLARFTDPGAAYTPLPLWWWSGGRVTRDGVRRQMAALAAQGVRQAVVMCLAPTGPMFGSLADDPPFLSPRWVELLDGACEDARELGFHLWMYDQIGFSGANFQGRLTAARPEFAGLALHRGPDGVIGERVSGFDYFGVAACAALLDQVHGELERQVGRWFGTVIPGFFQDELPPMPTWGREFAATFEKAYGYDLVPLRGALFADGATGLDGPGLGGPGLGGPGPGGPGLGGCGLGGPEAARVRRDYHAHRATLARRAFFDPLDAWFAEHGLICGFDQASPAREGDPVGGVRLYGDYPGTHRGYGAPGSDHWGDPKAHSSLAHAHGAERTWIEAFHSSGWGGTPEETYDWLAPFLRRGATLYDPHAVYYTTAGGWWEWAPPSTCWRQPYWPSYHQFAGAVTRLCAVLTAGTHVCDTVLLSPTSTAQAYLTLEGPLEPARRAAAAYHELNGVSAWYAERRGVLERAGADHDTLDEATVAGGTVTPGGGLRIGAETYRNVVVPDAALLDPAAVTRLAEFARAGGRVVCVGPVDPALTGLAVPVATAAEVPGVLLPGPVRVRTDVPYLLRRLGDTWVLLLTAHDEHTGTRAPLVRLPGLSVADWPEEGFPWDEYWRQLREDGYDFVPSADRRTRVTVEGLPPLRAQRWDPRTGARTELCATRGADADAAGVAGTAGAAGAWEVEVEFSDGPVVLLVLGAELPPATREALGAPVAVWPVAGPWRAEARSTLDNRHGDLAAASRTGVLPVEVWRMEHRAGAGGEAGPAAGAGADRGWVSVVAGYGPFAEVRDPGSTVWRPACWSLSRGLHKDPVHQAPLGPKGYVPEEFLDWREVARGATVAVRTLLDLPEAAEDGAPLFLAVGSGAARRVWVDGAEVAAEGAGYQSFSPLPARRTGRPGPAGRPGRGVEVEIAFTAERDGPLRASFAVVTDPAAYRRPEWLTGAEPTRIFRLDRVPAEAEILVGCEGACTVLVNGVEVGRQGDFNPYPGHREIRVHPYDLRAVLRPGVNTLALRLGEGGAATVDSATLDVLSGPGWVSAGLRRTHPRDPRFLCARVRPHPLPGAHWLEPGAAQGGTVLPLVPRAPSGPGAADGPRTEWLRFSAPLGTTALRIPTGLAVAVSAAGHPAQRPGADGRVVFGAPLDAGTEVTVRVTATDGRSGGALLDAAVEAEVAEAPAGLVSWETLGLRALGGEVRYRTAFRVPPGGDGVRPGGRLVLDLGEVRGTADVVVNGALVDRLVWGPWRTEITGAVRPGKNDLEIVVRGTLAGYLDDASPTRAIVAGQVRTGLFGPVRLVWHSE
ncbi:hypothetical protein AB0O07_30565 [Streptomyces sp. NPDC093085]|uniref:hypothetical protein n=1 Tax=Streptomyces sp. NPDC093085 TaxID=3155068 RepID=UPI0034397355